MLFNVVIVIWFFIHDLILLFKKLVNRIKSYLILYKLKRLKEAEDRYKDLEQEEEDFVIIKNKKKVRF
jgi:hypothetical protein